MAWPTITQTLSVEFVPGSGTYVDLYPRVKTVSVNHPRSNALKAVDASPTVLTAVIKNFPDATGFCPLTPNSPASARYPHVTENRRVKLTVTVGASTYVRFWGWSDRWEPDVANGDPNNSTVTLTASCVLSRYARVKSLSVFGDAATRDGSIDFHDYYPFDEPADASVVRGISSDGVPVALGEVIPPAKTPGSLTFSEPSGGHLMDGEVDFSRGNDEAPAPVIRIPMRPGELLHKFQASFKPTADPITATFGDAMITAYDSSGARLWVWAIAMDPITSLITWQLYDNTGANKSFNSQLSPRDDAWHYWEVSFGAALSGLIVTEKGGAATQYGYFAWSYDPRPVATLIVGGQMWPNSPGKQRNTYQGSISSLLIQYVGSGGFNYAEFGVPGITSTAGRALAFINYASIPLDTIMGGAYGSTGPGTDDTLVAYTNQTKDQLERWNEHVRSVGGLLGTHPDGKRYYLRAVDARPTTVSLTLDANADVDMPSGGWSGQNDPRPTRVKATGPIGAVESVNTAAETLTGMQLDGPGLSLSAGTLAGLESAADMVMAGVTDRLQFGLDATLTSTDKTAAIFGIRPGDRIRIQNLPTALTGVTYRDVYASGWTETYDGAGQTARFQFDTDPADDPPEGVWDSATTGRIAVGDGAATVTGGTCVGTTTTGTLIVTSTSPITNTGGEFSMDLDWQGERITVSGVGGATSPQTFTVTARGVAPSVARVHSSGETLELFSPITFGF
jgi:hypothetical protein